MHPHPAAPSIMFPSENVMKRLLGAMSIFTLVMTVPQILIIWLRQEAAGVSLLFVGCVLRLRSDLVLVWGAEAGSQYLYTLRRLDSARWRSDHRHRGLRLSGCASSRP